LTIAGDLVQVRQHQQQALRRGEGGGQRAGLQRAVNRAGGAGFGLHLHHLGPRAPEVRAAIRRPGVGVLAHHRCGRDGIDRDDLAQAIGDAGDGFVRIQGLVTRRLAHGYRLHSGGEHNPGGRPHRDARSITPKGTITTIHGLPSRFLTKVMVQSMK